MLQIKLIVSIMLQKQPLLISILAWASTQSDQILHYALDR